MCLIRIAQDALQAACVPSNTKIFLCINMARYTNLRCVSCRCELSMSGEKRRQTTRLHRRRPSYTRSLLPVGFKIRQVKATNDSHAGIMYSSILPASDNWLHDLMNGESHHKAIIRGRTYVCGVWDHGLPHLYVFLHGADGISLRHSSVGMSSSWLDLPVIIMHHSTFPVATRRRSACVNLCATCAP